VRLKRILEANPVRSRGKKVAKGKSQEGEKKGEKIRRKKVKEHGVVGKKEKKIAPTIGPKKTFSCGVRP